VVEVETIGVGVVGGIEEGDDGAIEESGTGGGGAGEEAGE
jgi:hypothetical protein